MSSGLVNLEKDVSKLGALYLVQKAKVESLAADLKSANEKIDALVNRIATLEGKFEERGATSSAAALQTPQLPQRRMTPSGSRAPPRSAQSYYRGIPEREEEDLISSPNFMAAMMRKLDEQNALMLEMTRQRSTPATVLPQRGLSLPSQVVTTTGVHREPYLESEEGRPARTSPPRQPFPTTQSERQPLLTSYGQPEGGYRYMTTEEHRQARIARLRPQVSQGSYQRSPPPQDVVYEERR